MRSKKPMIKFNYCSHVASLKSRIFFSNFFVCFPCLRKEKCQEFLLAPGRRWSKYVSLVILNGAATQTNSMAQNVRVYNNHSLVYGWCMSFGHWPMKQLSFCLTQIEQLEKLSTSSNAPTSDMTKYTVAFELCVCAPHMKYRTLNGCVSLTSPIEEYSLLTDSRLPQI